jgi:hypothetical protein
MDMSNAQSEERGKIPDLMKIGSIPSDLSQDMDTEVLDPVVQSDNFCRFVLSNKGFLHSFSKITLGVKDPGDGAQSTFPANIGVHSLVQRCALRIGTTTVAETDDFNHWMGYKSMFIDNDINLERETFLTSRVLALRLNYDDTVNDIDDVNASKLYIKNRNEPVADGVGGAVLLTPEFIRIGNTPVFSISVADLFPFLRFNQLPLYMIDQQISIELHFQPASSFKRCCHKKTDENQSQVFEIDQPETKFIADYIYYEGDLMESYRNQNRVMRWTYNDYRLSKRSISAATLATRSVIDIGGAGRLVNKVITALERTSANPDTSIINAYNSTAPTVTGQNNATATTNLIYNDNRLYPIDRVNMALHFHDLVQTEQNVPQICRQMFNKQGGGLSAVYLYNNYAPSSSTDGLNGKFFYLGYRLNRNERVNSRGIQIELQYSKVGAGSYTHRTWLELVKSATLDNGKFSCDFE